MTSSGTAAGRCAGLLNSLHSALYFAPELPAAFDAVTDEMAVYLVARAAPLGAVGPGAVAGLFNAFAPDELRRHLPAVWDVVQPAEAAPLRLRAADGALRRLLGDDVGSAEVAEAADLALRAAGCGVVGGRPMASAAADLPVPDEPHLVLWHAATVLREHRGDGHVAVLGVAGLTGLEALVTHCATAQGMPKELVMTKRGWTESDWRATEARLRARGLLGAPGSLTAAGAALRDEVERETDRLDRPPYERLGSAATERLTELLAPLIERMAVGFPPVLRDFFVPAA